MKNNEMVSSGIVSFKLPEKFGDDHPVAAAALILVPIVLPYVLKGIKYIVDKKAETACYKVLVEHGYIPSSYKDDFETISTDESIVA